MKRVFVWILGIAAVAAAAVAALLSRVDADFVVRQIAETTARATGKPLRFDSPPALSFVPPGVHFERASWGEATDDDGISVSVKGGMAQLELGPLLSGNIVVREIRLDNPTLTARQGRTSTEKTGQSVKSSGTAPASPESAASSLPSTLPIELKRLVLRQGAVIYDDAEGQSLRLNDVNLSAENLRAGAEAVVQCDFSFALKKPEKHGADAQPLAGNLALSSHLRFADRVLSFRQTALTVTPLSGPLPKEAGPLQLSCEGALALDGMRLQLTKAWLTTPQARLGVTGEALLTEPSFNGALELDGSLRKLASLADVDLKPAPQGVKDGLRFKSAVRYSSDSLALNKIQMQLDDISLSGDVRLGLASDAPVSVTADVSAGAVNLDNYLPLPDSPAKTSAEKQPASAKATGNAAKEPVKTHAMPTLDMRAKIDSVHMSDLTAKKISLEVKGEKGRYAISPFSLALGTGGDVKGTARMDMGSKICAIKSSATGVAVGPLLEALGKGRPVDGQAALDADMTMKCTDAAAVRNSLSGQGLLEIRQLHVPGLSSLSKNVSVITGKEGALPDRFDLARAPFTMRDGELTAAPVSITSSGLTAAGRAQISIPQQRIEAAMDVKTLGMTIPVIIKGPLGNASYSIDPRFALDMAKKLPGALIDTGKNTGEGAGGLLQQGAKGAGGIIRGLLGR